MPVYTSSIEVTADYPTIKPSLNLNFARSRSLDPRVGFERASVGTYIGRDGLIKTAGNDEPRFDHDPETLESLGLLIEEQRTNYVAYSENFDNAAWTKASCTVTANQIVSPSGELTADLITAVVGLVNVTYNNTTTGPITMSVYLKPKTTSTFWIRLFNASSAQRGAWVNLNEETIGTVNGGSAILERVGNGWYRFIYKCDNAISGTSFLGVSSTDASTSITTSTAEFYMWGAQVEAGSFPTSYIPTSGSAVTRADDFGYITGENFSSWFNQTEGSLDVGYRLGYDNASMRVCQISNQNSNTAIDLVVGSGGGTGGYWFINTGGVSQFSSTGVTNSSQVGADRNFRCVLAYKENDCAAQQDKVSTISTDTTSVTLATDYDRLLFYQIANSGDQIQGHLKYIRYYPKRISNAQVTQLSQDGNV